MSKPKLLRSNLLLPALISSVAVTQLYGCDGLENAKTSESELLVTPHVVRQNDAQSPAFLHTLNTASVPYPLYPNAKRYHIDGEGSLKIVLFETSDPFYKVDAYYRDYIDNAGLSRLLAMSDYVRYSAGEQDFDPWATDNPGIVIHEFPDALEAVRLGANDTSRTNIIMSF